MDSSAADHLLSISPNQQLAVDECGDPHGTPILFFHGWPASRLQGAGFSVEARELGARILAPDRPGIGLSSPQPGRRLLDWPPLVREMARQLGLTRFHVLGVSGGGPYALAAAWALPDLVQAASIVSGAPPLGPEVDRRGLLPIYRALLTCYHRFPGLLATLFRVARPLATLQPPAWLWPLLLRAVPADDRGALRDPAVFSGSMACYREAWRGSGRGVFTDAEVYGQPWGFAPEEVTVPVRLWHGRADASFSWRLAEALARRLPHCQTHFLEGEGHFSLPIRHRRAILTDLLATPASLGPTSPGPARVRFTAPDAAV